MSFWIRLGVTVQDLDCFRKACEQNGITFEENEDKTRKHQGHTIVATIRDQQGAGMGYLVREGGAVRVRMDGDPAYNTIIRRLGQGGGKLGQDYSEMIIRQEARRKGGTISRTKQEADGWRTVYVGVAR
jgi:hypothetical protein